MLPLTHITRPDIFLQLLDAPTLRITHCDVYGEDLLYLFYGRPAYRPFAEVESTSQPGFRPVCLLLDPSSINGIARLLPFDSGAFSKQLYQRHVPPYMTLEHFALSGGVDTAARFVTAFFGANRAYYLGRLRRDLDLSPTDLVAHAYCAILNDTSATSFDDRRGSIEVHAAADIELTGQSVKAVALPSEFLEDMRLRSRLLNDWECDVIPYDVYHDQPAHDIREIMARVKDYLAKKELL